MISFCYSL